MANTTNLNLKKPGLDDDALISDINNNMDLIDTFAGTALVKTAQSLTNAEKTQVRTNIGAAGTDIVDDRLQFVQLASVPSNSSKSYNLANDTKAIFVAFGATAGTKGFWIVNLATASVTIKDIATPANLTMTATSGQVTIANSANNGARVYAVIFAGSAEDAT